MSDIDKDLINQLRKGDLRAFEEIYRRYGSFVYSVAYNVLGNRSEAEDLVQDVFLRLYRKVNGFMFRSSLKTYIYRTTVNTALNYLRKRRDSGLKEEALKADDRPNNRWEDKELVRQILRRLSPDARLILVLREVEGLAYEDIGRALGIGVNTVKSRLNRAREEFRKQGRILLKQEGLWTG